MMLSSADSTVNKGQGRSVHLFAWVGAHEVVQSAHLPGASVRIKNASFIVHWCAELDDTKPNAVAQWPGKDKGPT